MRRSFPIPGHVCFLLSASDTVLLCGYGVRPRACIGSRVGGYFSVQLNCRATLFAWCRYSLRISLPSGSLKSARTCAGPPTGLSLGDAFSLPPLPSHSLLDGCILRVLLIIRRYIAYLFSASTSRHFTWGL